MHACVWHAGRTRQGDGVHEVRVTEPIRVGKPGVWFGAGIHRASYFPHPERVTFLIIARCRPTRRRPSSGGRAGEERAMRGPPSDEAVQYAIPPRSSPSEWLSGSSLRGRACHGRRCRLRLRRVRLRRVRERMPRPGHACRRVLNPSADVTSIRQLPLCQTIPCPWQLRRRTLPWPAGATSTTSAARGTSRCHRPTTRQSGRPRSASS